MKVILKDYQINAVEDVLRGLRRATRDFTTDNEYAAVSLSAPTGAGKTVIATAVIERIFAGDAVQDADPEATVLWITDDPNLNEQTRRKMLTAASTLRPAQLVTIDAAFDQAVLDSGSVYFLNIQKLGRGTSYVRSSNQRTYPLWITLANTIKERAGHLYIVIDEAHRGARPTGDRQTIVSRVVSDAEGVLPPSPVVWGISATPERFSQAMEAASEPSRTHRPVTVPIDEVRESGLLKDKILIKHPTESQPSDSTLTRLAVEDLKRNDEQWAEYAASLDEPRVQPVLVVQVKARAADAELNELLATLRDAWPILTGRGIAHTFENHTALTLGTQTVRYIEPQDIQDEPTVRVVLFKEALTTGWDCPRAEVMLSFRKAEDYTYISQLIGRMVRTPLARRIATNDLLNAVSLLLPYYDEASVDQVIDRLRSDPDGPISTIEKNPVECRKNAKVDPKVFDVLQTLPTYVVPGRAHRSQVARLHRLAVLLAGDGIDEQALAKADQHLTDTLNREQTQLETDGVLDGLVKGLATLDYQQKAVGLHGKDVEVQAMTAAPDARNIDDLLKGARRTLSDGLAKTYWGYLVDRGEESDKAKLITAALAAQPDVPTAAESAAAELVQTWLRQHGRAIGDLSEARKTSYYAIRAQAKESEQVDIVVRDVITASGDDPRRRLHLYVDGRDTYPCKLNEWESAVLEAELADPNFVAWYRNPTGSDRSVRVPYKDGEYEKPFYPDFVFFHKHGSDIRPSIVDPHGYHQADTGPKWRGLITYAERHGDAYARIDAVAKDEHGVLLRLDLKRTFRNWDQGDRAVAAQGRRL